VNTRFAVAIALVSSASSALSAPACSQCSPDDRGGAANDAARAATTLDPDAAALFEGALALSDGGRWSPPTPGRDSTSKNELDGGGPIDPACSGTAIDLARVIVDAKCATTSSVAKTLRARYEASPSKALRQEAKRADDGRVEVRLVNGGATAIAVPLSWHPKIAAFLVLADDDKERGVYELEPPRLDVAREASSNAPRFARILLPPGGVAFARVAIDPKVVRRVGPCADSGTPCAPAELARGKNWTLHVGQLVTDVETGAPATIAWDLP
jgi:hypothetical protein